MRDLRNGTGTTCWLIVTDAQLAYPARNFICLEKSIVRTIRSAVDQGRLPFLREDTEPSEIPQIKLETKIIPPVQLSDLQQFIEGKVYWLGFKQGDRNTGVWVADAWDAEYLGVDEKALKQACQLLEAEKAIELDSGEFGRASRKLLLKAREFETMGSEAKPASDIAKPETGRDWDLFICHASEDKEDFVRPLAHGLRGYGTKVWYDEFTLRIGDSLRRSIDRGLTSSRYGVVVLSPAFFEKEWPQRELDGLVAKEINGKKVILPVWHNVTREEVCNYSPPLADRFAAQTYEGIDAVVKKIADAISA